jgi:hypothetical protein
MNSLSERTVLRDISSFYFWLSCLYHFNHVSPIELLKVEMRRLYFFLLSISKLNEDNSHKQIQEDVSAYEDEYDIEEGIVCSIVPYWTSVSA